MKKESQKLKVKESPKSKEKDNSKPKKRYRFEDREKIAEQLRKEYADVFKTEGELRTMVGPPMKINLKDDAVPFAIYSARTLPLAYREPTRLEL